MKHLVSLNDLQTMDTRRRDEWTHLIEAATLLSKNNTKHHQDLFEMTLLSYRTLFHNYQSLFSEYLKWHQEDSTE